ncbi:MAG TPA: hypothetical protein VGC00_02755 [Thermoanaerobaculia bacterium]|jgi:hypothetical protein
MDSNAAALAPVASGSRHTGEDLVLVVSSLLAVLLFSLHVADDIVRGYEPGTLWNASATLVFSTWLYATLILVGRRSGYWILLVASLMGSGIPILHMKGAGVGGKIAASDGGFFFIWTLLAFGTTSILATVLSARGLWRLRRGQPR